jgi:hypothetical protein
MRLFYLTLKYYYEHGKIRMPEVLLPVFSDIHPINDWSFDPNLEGCHSGTIRKLIADSSSLSIGGAQISPIIQLKNFINSIPLVSFSSASSSVLIPVVKSFFRDHFIIIPYILGLLIY